MAIAITGTHSGVGKTTVTLAILAALRHWQIDTQSFKVGPDYIDPMFHTAITGNSCRNLDAFLTSAAYVRRCFADHATNAKAVVIEGVMGLFDGAGSSEFASTAYTIALLGKAVKPLLVVDCAKISRSLAAMVYGYQNFDPNLQIAGLILNRVGSDRHRQILLEAIAPLNIPVVGVIPRTASIQLSDRHLGLIPTEEVGNWQAVLDQLTELGKNCFDWQQLMPMICEPKLTSSAQPNLGSDCNRYGIHQYRNKTDNQPVRIAVARDLAFNFYYADNLELLQQMGAELLFWSPLKDQHLPTAVHGLYFGGGFPEIFATELAANKAAIAFIRQHRHLPIYAECGGLMYLSQSITNFEQQIFPMVGLLPTATVMTSKLTLGYRRCQPYRTHPWLPTKRSITGHEFHRSNQTLPSANPLYQMQDYAKSNLGLEGWYSHNLLASYVHLHWGNNQLFAWKFISACRSFRDSYSA